MIAYKDAFFDEASSTLCIVMEFAGSGDLYEKIMKHQKFATEFSENEIWDALVQMTAGLKALHDKNIFHRDLKSANIFRRIFIKHGFSLKYFNKMHQNAPKSLRPFIGKTNL